MPAPAGRFRAARWLAAAAIAAQACGARPSPPRNELRVALATAPISFDPHATDEIVSFLITSNIYDALVTTDSDLNPAPGLASKWFNPDPRTWIFDLEAGGRFQDGSPLTSEDVAYSVLRAQSDPRSEWGAGLSAVESVETPSATRVVVRTRVADAMLLQTLAQTFVVPRTAGGIAGSSLKLRPVGSGPYRLESWDPAAGTARLVAWEGHRGPHPPIDRLTFSSVSDDRERVEALLSGRVDLASDVPPELAPRVASARNLRLIEVPGLTEIHLGFDVHRPRTPYASPARNPFLDRRVRRAILAAIDRETLVRDVLLNAGEVAYQPVAPTAFGFDPRPPRPTFDVALARGLMAEAGFAGGFSVTLDAPQTSFVGDARVAPFVARSLGEIGIRVQLRSLPKDELFQREEIRDTSLFIAGWNCGSGDIQE
ncbi:MAG: ABC transporter substrate-binding protein, partial [Thermoplasmata archaeon]|nr:ABC transporter substrate-binding protein [Thermoplasmata archaeon]